MLVGVLRSNKGDVTNLRVVDGGIPLKICKNGKVEGRCPPNRECIKVIAPTMDVWIWSPFLFVEILSAPLLFSYLLILISMIHVGPMHILPIHIRHVFSILSMYHPCGPIHGGTSVICCDELNTWMPLSTTALFMKVDELVYSGNIDESCNLSLFEETNSTVTLTLTQTLRLRLRLL